MRNNDGNQVAPLTREHPRRRYTPVNYPCQLAMWGGCNIRLSLPVVSYDQAQIDLELNTWHLRLVQGLMATPRVSPPPSLTVYVVCLTASQPGFITVNQRGDLCHAPVGTLGMFLTQVHQAFALVHPDVDFGILARGDSHSARPAP
jgi:hypothetical protein